MVSLLGYQLARRKHEGHFSCALGREKELMIEISKYFSIIAPSSHDRISPSTSELISQI